ncbi:Protein transport protein Sec24C [Parelaphostrongylus tenuis]|uniref:Protein transport protein Sec24C n=1 Tax=Parelaphostrongylus tenuis TaxID=148309 RepID=A0AAD5MR73_PARTN|nr:Protein transport protein Sec24C [Parelaphostrongylus tenuis]
MSRIAYVPFRPHYHPLLATAAAVAIIRRCRPQNDNGRDLRPYSPKRAHSSSEKKAAMFAPPFPPTNVGKPEMQPPTAPFPPSQALGGAPNDSMQTAQYGALPKSSLEPSYGYPANPQTATGYASVTQPSTRYSSAGPAPHSTAPFQPSVAAVNGLTSNGMRFQTAQPPHPTTNGFQPMQNHDSDKFQNVQQFPPAMPLSTGTASVLTNKCEPPVPTGRQPQETFPGQSMMQQFPNATYSSQSSYGTNPQQQVQQTTSIPSQSGPFQSASTPHHSNQLQQHQADPHGQGGGIPRTPMFPPPMGSTAPHPDFPSMTGASTAMTNSQDGLSPPRPPGATHPNFPSMGGASTGMANFQDGLRAPGPPGTAHPNFPSMTGASTGMVNSQDGFRPLGPPGPPGFQPQYGATPSVQGGPPTSAPGFPPAGPPGGPPIHTRQPQPLPQPQQRLDPNMMPSAVEVMEIDSAQAGQFPTGYPHANPPPLVSTDFYAVDQGNCSPRLMRSTLYMAPASSDLLKSSQIPFAVACSPFAKLHAYERPPPVIDLGAGGPVRCQRCKAYMCPFMEFQDGGRRFRCPFCHASTPVEDVYFAHLDHTGRRTDIDHRPELFLGAYEFIATKQYCKNGLPPKEPAYIFMIDVSYNAIQNGMLHIVCSNLERILQDLPKDLGASESVVHVGLAVFDQVVHFFDLSAAQPSVMVVGDVDDMFVPIVDGLLLPYSQAAQSIRAVLAEIPRLFSQSRITETILGPVVQAGLDALQCADRAGKLMVFSTSLPTFEAPGKLKARNDRSLLGTEKEKTALMPQDEFYTKLGEQCVKAGVSVDLFLFPNSFMDVASIAQLSAVTGGSVYKYQYFVAEKDTSRFLADLSHDVSRQVAFDCMARVRSSAGIRPITFQGSFYMENSTDLEIASIDEDKSFFAELNTMINFLTKTPLFSVQFFLRLVADQGALVSFLLKNAVQTNRERGLKEMKEQIFQRCAQILATYREKVSESAPLGQLILPETLKLLPLFVNSIVKNDSINGGSEMTVDDKVWMIELIRGMRMDHSMLLLYPKIVPVDHLEVQDPSEMTSVAGSVRASYENLSSTKAYLVDNGIVLFLWIGLGVAATWVNDVFGVNNVAMLDTENAQIPEKDNARSRGLRRAVELIQEVGPRKRKLFIVREKDALEPWMKKFLVEDRSGPNVMSYVDFLCYIHREIRNLLA